ncbi:cystatin-B-like [Sphaeramia orbicularis]|uniref:cystatin-B-like n=1 Tax=Sphaeramia orbicularis TaxID=375764 RepID=UPI001181449D|nr:cystatin-B-like [Sphaeramia orbicularis]
MAALPITHGGPGPVIPGYGPIEEATEGFVILCHQLKTRAQAKAHKVFDDFAAISYRAQIVAGKNFIFKILVGGENYIHAKVFWALPCYGGGVVLVDVQENKTKTDSIEPF